MSPTCLILSIRSIPDNIGSLTSLSHLDLSNNIISGMIIRDYDKNIFNFDYNMIYLTYRIHPKLNWKIDKS
jgi:hypothetical protein